MLAFGVFFCIIFLIPRVAQLCSFSHLQLRLRNSYKFFVLKYPKHLFILHLNVLLINIDWLSHLLSGCFKIYMALTLEVIILLGIFYCVGFQGGMTMSDQIDLLVEQVKMLAGEIAFGTSTLKRLVEQSVGEPDSSKTQVCRFLFLVCCTSQCNSIIEGAIIV